MGGGAVLLHGFVFGLGEGGQGVLGVGGQQGAIGFVDENDELDAPVVEAVFAAIKGEVAALRGIGDGVMAVGRVGYGVVLAGCEVRGSRESNKRMAMGAPLEGVAVKLVKVLGARSRLMRAGAEGRERAELGRAELGRAVLGKSVRCSSKLLGFMGWLSSRMVKSDGWRPWMGLPLLSVTTISRKVRGTRAWTM